MKRFLVGLTILALLPQTNFGQKKYVSDTHNFAVEFPSADVSVKTDEKNVTSYVSYSTDHRFGAIIQVGSLGTYDPKDPDPWFKKFVVDYWNPETFKNIRVLTIENAAFQNFPARRATVEFARDNDGHMVDSTMLLIVQPQTNRYYALIGLTLREVDHSPIGRFLSSYELK
ncbi:MAG TPA: hypothetical protein VHE23_07015 [Candidatus Acidoferrales bacterium]|nr:hypothetical protein [Candidatus Acidoferrales bacterium]